MARKLLTINQFYRGISPSDKLGDVGFFRFAQNLDIYGEPSAVTLNPRTVKESGSVVTDLVKWIVSGIPYDDNVYAYDLSGKIYKRTPGVPWSTGTWSSIRTVANSLGQGMELFSDYIYYVQNTQIGRYGPLSSGPGFTDNWQTGLNDTTDTGYAPVKAFRSGFAVGHGNKLAWWDGAVWTLDRLVLPPGYEIRSLELVDEYLAIAANKTVDIGESEQGYVFFWDGDATFYNFFVKSEEGAINGMINNQNRLFGVVGTSGSLFFLYPTVIETMNLPDIAFNKSIEVAPGALTNWKNIIHFGVAVDTDSEDLYQGVYQWGSKNASFPEGLNFGFTISEGVAQDADVKIGSVKNVNNNLFIGWKDAHTVASGIDIVRVTNDPYPTGFIEFLQYDGGDATREDLALNLKAYYSALNTGESIQLAYRTNRAASYTLGVADTLAGDTHTRLPVDSDKARFYDFQMKVLLATSTTTAPTLFGVSLKSDDLTEEQKV